jgi:hypothetical protein
MGWIFALGGVFAPIGVHEMVTDADALRDVVK